jgi:hypothetical protein
MSTPTSGPGLSREEFDAAPSICVVTQPRYHPASYEHGCGPGPALCDKHAKARHG